MAGVTSSPAGRHCLKFCCSVVPRYSLPLNGSCARIRNPQFYSHLYEVLKVQLHDKKILAWVVVCAVSGTHRNFSTSLRADSAQSHTKR